MITKTFCNTREDVARYVTDLLYNLDRDCAWTMTIKQGTSEDYYALIVTEGLSEDTVKALGWSFLDQLYNISTESTTAG